MTSIHAFLLGALAMASIVAAAFFVRFWRSTRDRLFLFLAAAFITLALDWVALALVDPLGSPQHYPFVVRLFAFALIIAGVVDKNRTPR